MRRSFWLAVATAVLVVAMQAAPASAQSLGGSCTAAIYSSDQISVVQNNIVVCNGSIWLSLLGAPAADPNYSLALGASALSTVTSGTYNIAIGANAMLGTSAHPLTGASAGNIAIGDNALTSITGAAAGNVAVGNNALNKSTVSSTNPNTAIGYEAMQWATTATNNTAIGNQAMLGTSANPLTGISATNFSGNVAIGDSALKAIQGTAEEDTAVGYQALTSNTTGTINTAIGYDALEANTGGNNTAVGASALASITTGNSSTAVGYAALTKATGSPNEALGYLAGEYITSGSDNIAIGYEAMEGTSANPVTGNYNTGVGDYALTAITGAAADNTVLGYEAGYGVTSGTDNTLVGWKAGLGVTGSHNIILGEDPSSAITSGSSNILIGNSLSGLTASSNYQLNIGNVITGTGLGTPSTSTVTIAGALSISGAATGPAFMTSSDARIKTNITPLENGLEGIAALTGVTYSYRPPAEREVGKELSLPVGKPQMGVIAQNVEQVFPEAVETMGPTGIKAVNYNMLMAPMIEAVKTLKRQNEALMAAVALLYAGLAGLFVMQMRQARSS
jgi:hypothetical protein